MNELIFILHILVVVSFVLIALRLGRGALISLVALQAVLANFFVVKQMFFLGFAITCSDVFAIGGILALNLLQEYYGKEAAADAVKVSFLGLVFALAMTQIHLAYLPTPSDQTHESFIRIFAATPRIVFASIGVFFVVQKLDVKFFGWLKGAFGGRKLPVRIAISLFCSQLLDTVLFSFFGLYGLVESIFDVVFISFAVKCLMILCGSPFTALSKRLVKAPS